MKKWLFRFFKLLAVLILFIIVWFFWNLRDRHPKYSLDLTISGADAPGDISVGFAAFPITPTVVDTWNDKNGDAKFKEEDGDTYNDNNHNGKFDAYWIAGFSNRRAANGVHDNVWARAVVFDDGKTRLAMVSLDAIGFRHDDMLDIRNNIPAELGIDYAIISSTHTHESNDLLGIWGESPFKNGVNQENLKYVKSQAIAAITKAVKSLRPAELIIAQDPDGASDLLMDTRDPIVLDPGLRLIQARDKETGATLGTLVAWGNHPETLWSDNLYISSDFPHYVREYIEKGVMNGDSLVKPGIGGIAVYINGAIGGLMTTRGSQAVQDPFRDTSWVKPTFDKAKAQGQKLAMLALSALLAPDTSFDRAHISVRAKTINLPLANTMFRLASGLGVLDFGMTGWFKTRSEVAVFKLGPVTFLAMPGEMYPEIVNGGVEAPDGQDFKISPIESPSLREMMPGDYKFVIGLANDEIGYIVPKSQWDVEPPFTYGRESAQYGEENSLGPETAPLLYKEYKKILSELPE